MEDFTKDLSKRVSNFQAMTGYRATVILLSPMQVQLLKSEVPGGGLLKPKELKFNSIPVRTCTDLDTLEIEIY